LGERGETLCYSSLAGADLLLTDVISFSVRTLTGTGTTTAPVTELSVPNDVNVTKVGPGIFAGGIDVSNSFPVSQQHPYNPATGVGFDYTTIPIGSGPQGVEVILRVWDPKTKKTRQLTI